MLIFKVQLQQNNDHQQQIGAKRLQQCQIDGGRRDLLIVRMKYTQEKYKNTATNLKIQKYSNKFIQNAATMPN